MSKAGLVQVSERYLMRVLGYKEGKLIGISRGDEHEFGLVKFIIEHPSMPEVGDGDYVSIKETVTIRER